VRIRAGPKVSTPQPPPATPQVAFAEPSDKASIAAPIGNAARLDFDFSMIFELLQ
jgi:hypothetical protein